MGNPKIIALAGKGGVGKTSLSAAFVRLLMERRRDAKILAIDADPAVGLSTALGIQVATTLDDIRKDIIACVENGAAQEAIEMLGDARFRIFDTIVEREGFSFLAIGRPETAGCYCKVNAYLKEVIHLLSGSFDYVVIDGEAGIEQINRRVMEKVTHLLLVSDASKKGLAVVQTIDRVARELMMYRYAGVILNRLPNMEVLNLVDTGTLPVLAAIGSDTSLTDFDIRGENVYNLPEDAPIVAGVRQALTALRLV